MFSSFLSKVDTRNTQNTNKRKVSKHRFMFLFPTPLDVTSMMHAYFKV